MTTTDTTRSGHQGIVARGSGLLGKRRASELLVLGEAEQRLQPFHRHYVGVRSIPVAQVIGTDSRASDFDRDFHPRRRDVHTRMHRVDQAFPDGDFPPIVAYQLGDAYFVIDGHHRVAVARRRGVEMIDAEVTELVARWHLDADADIVELIHAEQQRIFMHDSGLEHTRPDVRIAFSRPAGYLELLENVQIHGYHLMVEQGRSPDPGMIAADWYERVYLPTVEAIRREGLADADPEATDGDLFLQAYRRRRVEYPDRGCPPLDQLPPVPEGTGRRWGLRRLLGLSAT
jgi:hypothetical protein